MAGTISATKPNLAGAYIADPTPINKKELLWVPKTSNYYSKYVKKGSPSECIKKGIGAGIYIEKKKNLTKNSLQNIYNNNDFVTDLSLNICGEYNNKMYK